MSALAFQAFRRFDRFSCEFAPNLNLIVGANGSGKTTILEAIGFFGLGKSFRTHHFTEILQKSAAGCQIKIAYCCDDWSETMDFKRQRGEKAVFSHNGKGVTGLSEVVRRLPTQIFLPTTIQWFHEASTERRTALDWGAFYLYPNYRKNWLTLHRLLKQRNALLKLENSVRMIGWWDEQLSRATAQIAACRETYVSELEPVVQAIWQRLLPDLSIHFDLNRGWSRQCDYLTCLAEHYARDKALGYTTQGPHRADLRFRLSSTETHVHQFFSRGELKLFLFGFKLSQAVLLAKLKGQRTLYLMDDLTSELGENNIKKIIEALVQHLWAVQPIVTSLPNSDLSAYFGQDIKRIELPA